MDYRYQCLDRLIPKLAEFQPNNHCKIFLYIILGLTIGILYAVSYHPDPGQNAENIIIMTLFLTLILAFSNSISLMIFISIILCVLFGSLWVEIRETIDESHINKFMIYSFPIILSITLFYSIICCRNDRYNKIYFRSHVGFNILCSLLSILNRSSNVIVFFVWLINNNHTGWAAMFQLFLVIITATISTIFVQYKPPLNNDNNNDIDNGNNNGNMELNDNMDKLQKYFFLGKIFTFLSWGRIWFEMVTWDRNNERDNIMNGYHSIKIYELIFECFPSLALQIIISLDVFHHETVIISIIICCIYITFIIIEIVYDDQYLSEYKPNRSAATSTSTWSSDIPSGASRSIQASSGNMNQNDNDLELAVSNLPNLPPQNENGSGINLTGISTDIQQQRHISSASTVVLSKSGTGSASGSSDRHYPSASSQSVEMDMTENLNNGNNHNYNNNNNYGVVVNGSCACYISNCVIFIWTDFLMRIIPLWILTQNTEFILIYVVLLWSIDVVLYWRMIIKGGGNKLNPFLDVILFAWTGVVTGAYFMFSTKEIGYISSIVHVGTLSMEYWIRLILSIVVIIAMDSFGSRLGVIFIIAISFNVVCGYGLYFWWCRCKDKDDDNDVEEQQV